MLMHTVPDTVCPITYMVSCYDVDWARNAVWLQTALKTLMVMHRLMRESNISFVEEVGSCVLACCALCINADTGMASLPVIALLVKQALSGVMICGTRLHSTDSSSPASV